MRTLEATSSLTAGGWPGLKQGFRITRRRTVKGVATEETVHGITSLPPERADAATLSRLLRGHWRVENQLHYVRDVTFGEDACRVRSGSAPQILAACRNAVLHLLAGHADHGYAAALQRLAARPDEAMKLLSSTKLKK